MEGAFRISRILFAVAIVAFGVQCLIFSNFIVGLEPVRASVVPPVPWAWVNGVVLMAAGAGLLPDRSARAAALFLAGLFFLSTVLLHGPLLIHHLKEDADSAFHTLAVAAGALVLAAEVARRSSAGGRWERLIEQGGLAGRLCFGACTVGHGVMHFVFFQFTADFVPAWIPAHAFWAAATGVAQVAAGLAILSGVLVRPAAILSAAMYGSWVLIVHIPRVMAAPTSREEWTSVFIAAALSGSALIVAAALDPQRRGGRISEPA